MGRIAPGEAALHAGMALVRLAVLVGHHADDAVTLHLRLERAADAAIGAGRHHRMLGLAMLDDLVLHQRRCRAGLHAGAAGDAFRTQEIGRPRRDARVEAAARNRQREGALHLLAGPHAAIADDAFRRVVGEIGVGGVLREPVLVGEAVLALGEDVVLALIAVAHFAQADGAGHVLQFAIAIGRAGQAIQRMVGDVELHHALAQAGEVLRLGAHNHSVFCRSRA